jgi:hypothetical protein
MNIMLNSEEWKSILKGTLVAAVGAGLTYLVQTVSGTDFGTATPAVVAVLSVAVNYIRKVFNIAA